MKTNSPVAIVTGAANGIGWSIARRLAEDGFELVLIDRDAASLEARWQALRADGLAGSICVVDLSRRTEVLRLEHHLAEPLERVRVLVNNAGLSPKNGNKRVKFSSIRFEHEWRNTVETNLTAAFLLSQMVISRMKLHRRGRIINMSSRAGRSPTGTAAFASMPYLVTKTAILSMTRAMARELAVHGITVNNIAPGRIMTAMGANLPEATAKLVLKDIPVGRWGEPEDVSHVAAFLASDASGFITGATIDVNGGALML